MAEDGGPRLNSPAGAGIQRGRQKADDIRKEDSTQDAGAQGGNGGEEALFRSS